MTADIYDSDDAMNRSPPLVPQKIKYGVDDEPPPPFVPESARNSGNTEESKSPESSPSPSRKPYLPESQAQTRLGDSVLISYLDPNRPDIALHESQHPLADDFPKQDQTEHRAIDERDSVKEAPPPPQGDEPRHDRDKSLSPRTRLLPLPLPGEHKSSQTSPPARPTLPSPKASNRRSSIERPQLSPLHRSATKASPDLKARGPLSLPSLQTPPSSCSGPSSDTGGGSNQVLPSIHSALSALSKEYPPSRPNGLPLSYSYTGPATSCHDPPHDRQLPQSVPHRIHPNPFSPFPPVNTKTASNNPLSASQPSLWQRPPVPPPPPEPHHPAAPYDISPLTAKSPATNYPTPTEQVAPTSGPGERSSFSQPSANGAPMTGNYKCTHPDCTAPPFQTQYLLKQVISDQDAPPATANSQRSSHANVHSQERPHFCPVEGCPRGVGGKGFKRKNEMMRHGLVHNSPGYVCPFCPDQQHKYPRPDNLQRHVRVHHVDKNKDDPVLRQVLAQRPAGSTRGRRRRMDSG